MVSDCIKIGCSRIGRELLEKKPRFILPALLQASAESQDRWMLVDNINQVVNCIKWLSVFRLTVQAKPNQTIVRTNISNGSVDPNAVWQVVPQPRCHSLSFYPLPLLSLFYPLLMLHNRIRSRKMKSTVHATSE